MFMKWRTADLSSKGAAPKRGETRSSYCTWCDNGCNDVRLLIAAVRNRGRSASANYAANDLQETGI